MTGAPSVRCPEKGGAPLGRYVCPPMPHVLLDATKTHDLYSGLGQFGWHLGRALAQAAGPEVHLTAALRPGVDGAGLYGDVGLPVLHHRRGPWPWLGKPVGGFDLVHQFQQLSRPRPPRGLPRLLTVHDVNPLLLKSPRKARRYRARLQRQVDHAAALTTISRFTRDQLARHLDLGGREVHVIPNGVPAPPPTSPPWPPDLPPGRAYLLCLGLVAPRKRQRALLPLLAALPGVDLVLAGRTDAAYVAGLRQLAAAAGATARLHVLGPVSEARKHALYTHCSGLVFPSAAEGFGLPAIEAMHYGKPVFLARGSSLGEVGGELGYYFDAEEAGGVVTAVREGLADHVRGGGAREAALRARARSYDWPTAARAYLRLYKRLCR